MADDDKVMGMLCHLLAIFTGFIGPLVIWLVKKKESDFVDQNGKNVLNFSFTVLIAYVALMILAAVLGMVVPFLAILFVMISWVLGIAALVFYILGTLKANGGEVYAYPVAIPFLK